MNKIEAGTLVEQAFTYGYHAERLPNAARTTHWLLADAGEIYHALAEHSIEVDEHALHETLLYGVKPEVYEGVEGILGRMSASGDSIFIWTQGDPKAQIAKVSQMGWNEALRNPVDLSNFIVYASVDKMLVLSNMIEFASATRGSGEVFIVDDSTENIELAHELVQDDEHTRLIFLNHKGERVELPDGVMQITSFAEYENIIRQYGGQNNLHILDLDRTLINPENSKKSRLEAVKQLVFEGEVPSRKEARRKRRFNGLTIYDENSHFLRLTDGEVISADFDGHQAHIYRANGSLVKVFALDHRPVTSEWQEMGGYRGATELRQMLIEYRKRLTALGFPVPVDSRFLLAQCNSTRQFVVVEVVPYLGETLQDVFLHGTLEQREEAVKQILEVSFPILIAPGIGADIKPANNVVTDSGKIVNIDPLPVIMKDDQGRVCTEWPVIENTAIEPFLEQTHMTIEAIGFRFYQELCQLDPLNRASYQRWITEKLNEWVSTERITAQEKQRVIDAMNPVSSRVMTKILACEVDVGDGIEIIESSLFGDDRLQTHPIYALRDLAFLLTEYLDMHGMSINDASSIMLHRIERDLGHEVRKKVAGHLEGLPDQLHLLTLVRKLSHLSDTDIRAGAREWTAWMGMCDIAQALIYAQT